MTISSSEVAERGRTVAGEVNYAVPGDGKPRFHAKDSSLDTFGYDPRVMTITDARTLHDAPCLDREGFALLHMPTQVRDFRDIAHVNAVHPGEIQRFIAGLTDADAVAVSGPATLRFGDASPDADRQAHSKTARLIHSDTSEAAADDFTVQSNPFPDRRVRRVMHHNIWRTFSPPPQDAPLALCDYRTVDPGDVIHADAAFDNAAGEIVWTFEAFLFRYNPAHRWYYYPNMTADDVLVFKRFDSDRTTPWFVPHTAFSDRSFDRPVPRASVEMRTISYWYA